MFHKTERWKEKIEENSRERTWFPDFIAMSQTPNKFQPKVFHF